MSYHNHTTWSDGQADIPAMVEAARQAGLDEVGISDHYVLHPDGSRYEWSMEPGRLAEYVAEVCAAASSRSPLVRLGIEADFFPQTVETLRGVLAQHPFDYVIGSVHFADSFPIDEGGKFWKALTPDEVDAKWRLYWIRVRQMAESGVFDMAAHLDLPKKFGYRPAAPLTDEVHAALDAIAAAGMSIEINTSGWNLAAKEAYPATDLLRAARERDLPLSINADAHMPAHLTRHFDRAFALAREVGYTQVVRYERRQRFGVDL